MSFRVGVGSGGAVVLLFDGEGSTTALKTLLHEATQINGRGIRRFVLDGQPVELIVDNVGARQGEHHRAIDE